MHRRSFLGLVSAVTLGLAGCSSGSDGTDDPGSGGDGTDTHEASTRASTHTSTRGTATPTGTDRAYSLAVSVESLRPGLVTPDSPDSIGVTHAAGQYLTLLLDPGGEGPPPEDIALAFDGADHGPLALEETFRDTPWGRDADAQYDGDGAGWLVFALPDAGDATSARLHWPGGEWHPDGRLRERLGTPTPRFDVSVDAPDAIAPGEQPWFSVTAANRGDVPGGFVGALDRVGPRVAYTPVEQVSFVVPAGDREKWRWEPTDLRTGADPESRTDSIRLPFDWHADDASPTVAIAAETATDS